MQTVGQFDTENYYMSGDDGIIGVKQTNHYICNNRTVFTGKRDESDWCVEVM